MLVLRRKAGQQLHIGDDIVITTLDSGKDGGIRIGIQASKHLRVLRGELITQVADANTTAANTREDDLLTALTTRR